ncbi:MAG: NlpC/P60 family protein, partial [Tannerella sp.]|nr:NlpC/P60 family protein [Tannerella sp.]
MKRIINALLIFIAGLSIASCSIRKQPAPKPGYDRQTAARLSKQFGVRLTPADNIRLYDACSSWLGVKYRYGGNTKTGV